ncbi:MAG TPA: enoyl-CoA hydratase/isomerase family protein [Macromonas sp.]|nr:enoyl-CoA hydratase/isomerase family protein [Macromonas sp.]
MNDAKTQAIRLDIANNVAEVVLSQPERGNPFDDHFCARLCDIANDCSENRDVRAVLIRAEGKYFSVGADLKWLGKDRAYMPRLLKGATSDLHMAIARFARGNAPVVIAVHGLAAGGSTALTAMADFALASASSKFYAAYNKIGYASDGAGSYFIPRRVGSRKAAEFLMLNQTWGADEALRHGLINRIVPDEQLLDAARALAQELASGPTVTYGEMKRLLLTTSDQPLEAQLELEAQAIARCARTDDSWNAIQSLLNKRPVEFKGR